MTQNGWAGLGTRAASRSADDSQEVYIGELKGNVISSVWSSDVGGIVDTET